MTERGNLFSKPVTKASQMIQQTLIGATQEKLLHYIYFLCSKGKFPGAI
jgi:hypothetical protein